MPGSIAALNGSSSGVSFMTMMVLSPLPALVV
jgi:hypothetical protein